MYIKNTVKYEAIPFLTLVTGSIVLLNDIISKLFKFFSNKHRYTNVNGNIQSET